MAKLSLDLGRDVKAKQVYDELRGVEGVHLIERGVVRILVEFDKGASAQRDAMLARIKALGVKVNEVQEGA